MVRWEIDSLWMVLMVAVGEGAGETVENGGWGGDAVIVCASPCVIPGATAPPKHLLWSQPQH